MPNLGPGDVRQHLDDRLRAYEAFFSQDGEGPSYYFSAVYHSGLINQLNKTIEKRFFKNEIA